MASLLEAMKRAKGMELWDYADTVLELDDAKLIGLEDDPLWIWPLIEPGPPALHRHVDKRYAERIKETKQNLKHSND
jgi:hypothetical protein